MQDNVDLEHDDRLTIIAIAALACMLQTVLHEGLGHGVVAWLSGAHRLTLSTVALQSDIASRWISAAGTFVNFAAACVLLLLLRVRRYRPATGYFLVLALAGNLFTSTGYFLFSGFSNFGDWAEVIRGRQPHWAWQVGLVLFGVVSYYLSMLLVAAELRRFKRDETSKRLVELTWTPYFTDGILAALAGVFNPAGIFYVFASALPSTLGANGGLLSLPWMVRLLLRPEEQTGALRRSVAWIVLAGGASALYIFVLGRGVRWSR